MNKKEKQNNLKLSYYFETFGCQMNVADSDMLAQQLTGRGYVRAEKVRQADLIIVNTCSVRERAESRAKARLEEYGNIKKAHQRLWVIGCMAQRLGEELKAEIPKIDLVIGAEEIEHLPKKLDTYLARSEAGPVMGEYSSGISTFLPVMRGCDNFCYYCIVPYVRGREHSLPATDLLDQAKKLVDQGASEITLLGQNVNSYQDDSRDFSDLIDLLHEIKGLKRIRFTTSHPKDLSDKLIETIASLPKVCKHIHLPVQSGSAQILERMNRKYTRNHYLRRIEAIRREMPNADITTDVMVGFPGESEEDFKKTLSLFKEVRFTAAFMFAFSVRPKTKSAEMSDQVPEEIKLNRLKALIAMQTQITKQCYKEMVGQTVEVLLTHQQDRRTQGWVGQDYGCKRVLLKKTGDLGGSIVFATIKESTGMTLIGEEMV